MIGNSVADTFRIFAGILFAFAVIVLIILIVVSCKRSREASEQLRKIFRDIIVTGVIFGLLSWFLG